MFASIFANRCEKPCYPTEPLILRSTVTHSYLPFNPSLSLEGGHLLDFAAEDGRVELVVGSQADEVEKLPCRQEVGTAVVLGRSCHGISGTNPRFQDCKRAGEVVSARLCFPSLLNS